LGGLLDTEPGLWVSSNTPARVVALPKKGVEGHDRAKTYLIGGPWNEIGKGHLTVVRCVLSQFRSGDPKKSDKQPGNLTRT